MHQKFHACWLLLALMAGGIAHAQPLAPVTESAPVETLATSATAEGPSALSTLRAYAEMGHILAQYQLAQRYYVGDGVARDLSLAALWFQRAADAGEPRSQLALAQLHAKGEGVSRSERWAAYWTRQAAESGFRDAQLQLGRMYERGQGVSKDEAEAYFWYCLASDGGWSGDMALRERERLGPQLTHVQRTSARYAAFHWRPRQGMTSP